MPMTKDERAADLELAFKAGALWAQAQVELKQETLDRDAKMWAIRRIQKTKPR